MLPLALALCLAAGDAVTVSVTSKPAGAEVSLDKQPVGVTPLELAVPAEGKHTLTVSRAGFSTVTRVLANPKDKQQVDVELVDLELAQLKKTLARVQAEHAKADARLQKAQERAAAADSPKLAREVEAAEAAMEKAASALEDAEKALRNAEEARATDAQKAEDARKTREALRAQQAAGKSGTATPGSMPANTVFCAYDTPSALRNGVVETSYCTTGPLGEAVSRCTRRAKLENPAATECKCTADRSIIGDRCNR